MLQCAHSGLNNGRVWNTEVIRILSDRTVEQGNMSNKQCRNPLPPGLGHGVDRISLGPTKAAKLSEVTAHPSLIQKRHNIELCEGISPCRVGS